MKKKFDLIVAGGGTGGHFFSGVAFAQEYVKQYPMAEVLFVGVKRGIEGRINLHDKRFQKMFVPATGFKNMSVFAKAEALFFLVTGTIEMAIKLWQFRPKVVLGVGGYASASTMAAALLIKPFRGFRLSLVDQNSSPGLVTRVFKSLGVKAFSPFDIQGCQIVDHPVRREVAEAKVENFRPAEWPPKKIMVMGGSQGAAGLNKAWINILPAIKEHWPHLEFIHQAGDQGLDFVQSAYQDLGLKAKCFSFSDQIFNEILAADLVVARAGALSILELIHLERPTLFVPFPHAADDHQFKNARAVQEMDWIVAENQLNYDRLDRVLHSPKAKVPRFGQKARVGWKSVLVR